MIRRKQKQERPRDLGSFFPKRLGVLMLTILVLAIPMVIYFTRYISNQTSYFTSQNFRRLAGISSQLEQTIEIHQELFVSAAKQTLREKTKSDTEEIAEPEVKMKIETGGEDSRITFVSDVIPNDQPPLILHDIIEPLVEKRSIESARGSEHEQGFDAVLIASLKDDKKFVATGGAEPRVLSRVIYQSRSPELDIDSLDNLVRSDAPDKMVDLRTLTGKTGLVDVRIADTDYKVYVQPVDIPMATVGQEEKESHEKNSLWIVCGLVQANHFRRQTWAFPYTVLITVAFLTVLIALSWPFLRLIFIGPKDRLRLADVYLIAFAFLVGSAILTFFTLYGLTYRRSEYQLDTQLQNLSKTIAGYTDENHVFHAGSFHTEIDQISKEIDELNHRLPKLERESLESTQNRCNGLAHSGAGIFKDNSFFKDLAREPYPYFRRVTWTDLAGNMCVVWSTTTDIRRLEANQIKQRDWFTRIVEGKFRDLGQDHLWLEPVTSKYTGTKTVVVSKPIYSLKPDHKMVGVVAMDPNLMSLMQTVLPSGFGYRVIDTSGNDPGDDGDNDDPGKVVFQSSESHQLSENFFQECDNNRSLRSLVFGRASEWTDVNYKGLGHRLYVTPLKGFPNWSLIVFRNQQPLRTVYLETLTLAGFVFFAYAAILLTAFTILYVVKALTDEGTEWLWPSETMAQVYRQTLSINLSLCLLSVSVIMLPIFTDRPRTSIILICLTGFVAILVLALKLKIAWILNKVHWTANWLRTNRLVDHREGAYVWNMVVLLVLTGILPSIVFFKVAYNEKMKLFVKHAQFTIAQGLVNREAQIDSLYSTQRVDEATNPGPFENETEASRFIERRLNNPLQLPEAAENKRLDVYAGFFEGTRVTPDDEHRTQLFDSSIAFPGSLVPLFNETSVELGGLNRERADDDSYQWEEPNGSLAFHSAALKTPNIPASPDNEAGKIHNEHGIQIVTPLRRFGLPSFASRPDFLFASAWILSFAIIFALIFWLARLVVKKIFLLEVSRSLGPSTSPEVETTQNLFVVSHLPAEAANGFTGAQQFFKIDLPTDLMEENWVDKLKSRMGNEPADRVIIHHFEHGLHDPLINDQKLRLIESLLAARKVLVIVSAVEPARYSPGRSPAGGQHHDMDDDNTNERWARAISRFKKVYSGTRIVGVSEKALSDLNAAFESDSTMSQETRDRVVELAGQVYEECAPLPSLQDLCSDIIARLPHEDLDWNGIRRQIFDRAELYYLEIWHNCSDGERLTLVHLAQDRLLSPNDPDLAPLLRKRLIVFAPDLQLINETFKLFLLSRSAAYNLQVKETQAQSTSQWEAFKIPLFVGVTAVIVFLVFTQKDLYNSSWTLMTAMTTGIPVVFKVISLFQTSRGSGKLFNA